MRTFIVCPIGAASDADFDVLERLVIALAADQGGLAQRATGSMEDDRAFSPLPERLA